VGFSSAGSLSLARFGFAAFVLNSELSFWLAAVFSVSGFASDMRKSLQLKDSRLHPKKLG
jgi:hypothetical protein